jgi:hypothetical protein
MVLDARRRSSIYQQLVPLIGDENANALMSEFPSVEADELVTRQFLRAELSDLRAELAELESRMILRLGGAIAASTALLATIGLLT